MTTPDGGSAAASYFKAAKELARSRNAGGLVDFLAMCPVPLTLRGLISEKDQLRLCGKLYEEPNDQAALDIFLEGDAGGIGLAELIDGGHYDWQTATQLHETHEGCPHPAAFARQHCEAGIRPRHDLR